VSKKLLIMIGAGALVSFGGAFVFGWLTQSPKSSEGPGGSISSDSVPIAGAAAGPEEVMLAPLETASIGMSSVGRENMKKAMTEKQLKSLVYELRESVREHKNKQQGLAHLEQRLQMAEETLQKDIEHLNNLRVDLASMVSRLQSERDKLLKSRVEIAQAEQANLMSLASAYDKMDVSSAGKILTNMCVMGESRAPTEGSKGGGAMDDAVKILHYMNERTKAKLLAELVNSEPKLTAALCQRLKQIVKEE
jgi:flagellar motility protein MotE (MotC chaperone)